MAGNDVTCNLMGGGAGLTSVPGGGHPQYGRAAVTWPAGNLSVGGRVAGLTWWASCTD